VLNTANEKQYRRRRLQMNQAIAEAKAKGQSGAYVEEMLLWHGSPFAEKICKEGFNLRQAKHGLFGKGNFFNKQISCSERLPKILANNLYNKLLLR